jgi:hypothetical protein
MSMTATEAAEQAIEQTRSRARAAYERYPRFRMLVQSTVAHEINKHGPIDPDRAMRAAHDIATAVGATLLQRIYENDAELAEQKAMADHYRKIAEEALAVRPMPVFLARDAAAKD